MATRLDFDGLDAIIKDLNKMNQILESNVVDNALKQSIMPAYNEAKKLAPKDKINKEGKHMADNIPLKLIKEGSCKSVEYGWEKSDNSDFYYAKFVEWGTSNNKYPKRPFIYKSLKKNKNKCYEEFSKSIRKELGL